jgi:predicted amidohydrolase
MRLALWQGAAPARDPRAALAEVARVAEAARGADLLLLPEGFLTGYHLPGLGLGDLADVEAALAEVGRIAAAFRLAIVIGSHVEGEGRLRNAAVAFDPAGREIGRYHKRILFGDWEKATFAAGKASLHFDCAGFRCGLAICYDVEFPELVRDEALAGVELLLVPTAQMSPYENAATLLLPARALENQIFVAYCNRTGEEPDLVFPGLSRICGPRGEILVEAGADPALLVADLDRGAIAASRRDACYLDDLRAFRTAGP